MNMFRIAVLLTCVAVAFGIFIIPYSLISLSHISLNLSISTFPQINSHTPFFIFIHLLIRVSFHWSPSAEGQNHWWYFLHNSPVPFPSFSSNQWYPRLQCHHHRWLMGTDVCSSTLNLSGISVNIIAHIPHLRYNLQTLDYDMSILRFASPLTFGSNI